MVLAHSNDLANTVELKTEDYSRHKSLKNCKFQSCSGFLAKNIDDFLGNLSSSILALHKNGSDAMN